MNDDFICDGNTYILGGQRGNTIALPVLINGLPESIVVEGHMLLKKSAFHVSLVCIGRLMEKNGIDVPGLTERAIEEFCTYTNEHPVSLTGYTGEFRFVEENERKSVVAMCETENLDGFFDTMNGKYGLRLEHQPTHVTLFTLQPEKGIFLVDSDDLSRITKVIPPPTGISL